MTTFSPRRLLLNGLCVAALLMLAPSSRAVTLTPIEMDFTPTGRGVTQVFRMENTTAEAAAVEISIKSRSMKEDGTDILKDAEDDFTIQPAQLVLQPGQVQSIRVQWLGKEVPRRELAYRLIAEQLPIDIGAQAPQGGRVRLLVTYVASVYVVPAGAQAQLAIAGAEFRPENGGRLRVTVENRGTARRILKDIRLRLAGAFGTLVLDDAGLKGMSGENVLGGHRRTFDLAAPRGLTGGPLTASFD